MTRKPLNESLVAVGCAIFLFAGAVQGDDGYRLWLKYDTIGDVQLLEQYRAGISAVVVEGRSETTKIIRKELKIALKGLLDKDVPEGRIPAGPGTLIVGTPRDSAIVRRMNLGSELQPLGKEGFLVKSIRGGGKGSLVIAANEEAGLVYGTFHLLRLIQTHRSLTGLNVASKPRIEYRILDHWDNLDGSVERGFAGKSLWKWEDLPDKVDPRYLDYARANASIGVNGAVLNNVNANPVILKPDYLRKVARLADTFRPFGIRVFLSVNFASPLSAKFALEGNRKGGIGDLETTDPLEPRVRAWWRKKTDEIYRLVPDFGGFVVKANSEGMPGPQDYHRTHADGANMLAEALAPHHGIVMWRAFVYDAEVDADRAKRSYKEFVPLDGRFASNVFVQAKNGPIDFQPREPVQPLFGSMPRTPLMLELQVTQEYLGHSTHLVYLAPMWKEYFEFDTFAAGKGSTLASIVDGTLHKYAMTGIAGVANIGDDRNWCGHLFAQANWYAFGRLAWDHTLTADGIAGEWIRMTLGSDTVVDGAVKRMMMGSWEACIDYMTPLGLHHIMQVNFHYGPGPANDKGRQDWTSVYYHRADGSGIGFDRTSHGSDAVGQYFPPLRDLFETIDTCPEKYLLWFHHVPWDYRMKSGGTLWDELRRKYFEGTKYVEGMLAQWQSLEQHLDPEIYRHVRARLEQQKIDSAIWRDTCLDYFNKQRQK